MKAEPSKSPVLAPPTAKDASASAERAFFRLRGRTVHLLGRSVDLPASRLARIVIGILLLIGGCLSFLPVLGIWMLPLGFMVLSIDIPLVRRWRRRTDVRWTRWRAARKAAAAARASVNATAPDAKR